MRMRDIHVLLIIQLHIYVHVHVDYIVSNIITRSIFINLYRSTINIVESI